MTAEDIVNGFVSAKPDEFLRHVGSFFLLPILPEYLPSEMLTAACYRALGFSGMKDIWISQNGSALTKLLTETDGIKSAPFVQTEIRKMLKDVLLSPEDPKQKRSQKYSEYLFLAPIVPSTAYFSNPVRLKKNLNSSGGTPWNVELIFKALISYSSLNRTDSDELWQSFFEAYGVQEDSREDYFARIVEKLLLSCADAVCKANPEAACRFPKWKLSHNDIYDDGKFLIDPEDRAVFSAISPLDEIRRSLRAILKLKKSFSRWQWMTMLDAQMRLSVVALILWLLELHHVVERAVQKYVIEGCELPDIDDPGTFKLMYQEAHIRHVFSYGEGFAKAQKLVVTRYARNYLRLAFFLSLTKELSPEVYSKLDWSSVSGFVTSIRILKNVYSQPEFKNLYNHGVVQMLDAKAEDLNPKKSRLKHILEFFTVLRQRAVVETQSDFIRYDQSYMVHKKGSYASAPYVVDMGSVACFVVVFCCADGRRVFPLKDLNQYLERYYVSIHTGHTDQFLEYLKGLGLTMDSPDAGDGLMVRNPFFSEVQ